jgi:WD40 repeat protein
MKSIVIRKRFLAALGLSIIFALVLVACGGSQQSIATPTPKQATTSLYTYRGHAGGVTGVAWSPDGKYIASATTDNTVEVWEAMTGHVLLTYRGHADLSGMTAWSPDGKYIAASEWIEASEGKNCNVQVFDAMTGNLLLTYRGHASFVWSLAWSPDGKRISSASEDGTVQIWQAP